MSTDIREYCKKDHAYLIEMATGLIDRMASLDPHHLFRPKEDFNAEKYIEARLKKVSDFHGKVLIAFVDKKPAGYLMATIEESEGVDALSKFPIKQGIIDALFVSEIFRGKGVSSSLLESIEEFFRESGCEYAEISCLATNEDAQNIYRKKGYQERYIDFLKKL
ncbi:hypothetical protein COU78_00235 [Candidatus Peregrinibacteria bacterium CG10_big_fil_rev_8_21_14_0_10_49_24]|nr:MAG: hypothetical protein COV83_06280 [Candidatus Peregrinibacteria bacterium CG11_big_fil_rev_8_21_14_0_20_49_14]PIR51616.1 MAG: hypothetical protein COU78_00235 [Candidatus Peregrinibacteria bacterium CG10_big_fil_rev_8_21_14_0_10_49_24]PJA68024.1 MAG: hypothetical protein CO157_01725 [Candidatus Peregrinibacteria bacterium CG_4_9_14_3_um_filter_49_12]